MSLESTNMTKRTKKGIQSDRSANESDENVLTGIGTPHQCIPSFVVSQTHANRKQLIWRTAAGGCAAPFSELPRI